jgi:hypothetical protein
MNLFAALFMGISWTLVLSLLGWASYKLFTRSREGQ